LYVKLDCPHCTNTKYISFSEDEDIVAKDRDKLTGYLYDHIKVNDIFFAEELINDILKVLSKTKMKEINLHPILADAFGIEYNCCQES
jgi:hypothetical protein